MAEQGRYPAFSQWTVKFAAAHLRVVWVAERLSNVLD